MAWDGHEVAGQVRSYIDPRRMRSSAGGGATPRTSRLPGPGAGGGGRALIAASLHELAARGMDEAALSVHTENPTGAFQLYESMGYPGGPHVQGPEEADGARSAAG